MPIPNPREGETERDFIGRCISTVVFEDDVERDQAAGICFEKWRKSKR